MKRSWFLGLLAVILMTSIIGCNAVNGAGKDIENAGKHIQNVGK